jgi:L-amino acid N-acyltransferase YncA
MPRKKPAPPKRPVIECTAEHLPAIRAIYNDAILNSTSLYEYAPRSEGVGRQLMQAVIAVAKKRGLHALIAGIDATNVASVALHSSLGFRCCGTVREAGFKFGRWLDLEFWQLILPTPEHPVDG